MFKVAHASRIRTVNTIVDCYKMCVAKIGVCGSMTSGGTESILMAIKVVYLMGVELGCEDVCN